MSAALLKTRLHTPVCDLLGCEYPIVLAGMGGVSRSELVLAVTQAGGFGFLGMVRESPRLIRAEIEKVRSGTDLEFGVNLIPAATKPDLLEAEISACIDERVPAIALFWDLQPNVVKRFRDSGALVICQIGDVPEAEAAQAAGAQILIAQGFEAGGHVRGRTPLHNLLPAVVAATDLPVLAAGGILDGHDLALALGQGAQGVVIGTAFLATYESFAHDFHKQRIVDALPGSTIHTDAFHVNWPKGAYVRVLENSVTRGEHGDPFSRHRSAIGSEGDRTIWLFSTDSPLQSMSGNLEAMALYAGDAAGRIKAIVPAGERLQSIVNEVQPLLDKAGTDVVESDVEVTSPVCCAREASDIYSGYASTEELLKFSTRCLKLSAPARALPRE